MTAGAGVELVVFDLDGTLVDSSADLAASVAAALERVAPGTTTPSVERVRSFIGDGARALIQRSLDASGVDRSADEVLPVFLDCYAERLLDSTRLYPGAAAALERLAGWRLAVLTNKPGELSRRLLGGLGLASRFERILGGGDVPSRKPDPEGLHRILEELRVPASRAAMVGDSAIDVRTGRAAGARTVGVRAGFDPRGVEAEAPDALLEDLAELPAWLGQLPPPPRG